MSNKRKNFHYHYAEQYESREERRARARSKQRFVIPPVAVILSMVMLMVFGLVSLTFSIYVTDTFDDPEMPSSGGLVVTVKNETVRDQLQSTNLRSKEDLDLADTGAVVDLTDTSWNYNGKTVFIKAESWWTNDSAEFRFRVKNGTNGTWYYSNAATTYSNNSAYKYTTIPNRTATVGQWVRCNPGTTTVWNEGATWNGTSNAYWTNGDSNSQYDFWPKGTTIYFDCTVNDSWEGDSAKMFVKDSNSGTTGGLAATKIATHLYKYTLTTDYDNKSLYWWRGSSASALWNSSAAMDASDCTIIGKNAVATTGSGVSNGNGTVAALSLSSLTKPTVDDTTTVFKADTAYTISVYNHSSIVLNYSFNGSSRTTSLISTDQVYTYYLDNTALSGTNTTGSKTIAANYFDGTTAGRLYGSHTVKVKVASTLTGLNNTSDNLSITVKDPNTCIILADSESNPTYTKAVNTKWSVTISSSYHTSGGDITVTGVPNYVQVCKTQNGTYTTGSITGVKSGDTIWLQALKPTAGLGTTADVVAACAVSTDDEDDESTPATMKVTISTPSTTPTSAITLWDDATANGAVTASPSHTVTYSSANTSVFTVASNGTITAKAAGTANLNISVVYNSSYTYTTTRSVTVNARPACYLAGLGNGWATSGKSMTYQGNNSNLYVTTMWLDPSTVYGQDSPYNSNDTYGFKIYYNGTYYAASGYTGDSHYWITSANYSKTLTTGSYSNLWIQTGTYGGVYTFTFNSSTKTLEVTYPTSAQYFLLGFGDGTNWDSKLKSDSAFAIERDITDGTATLTFAAGTSYAANTTYGFKVYCTDGTWYGKNSKTINHSNYTTSTTLASGNNNVGFTSWYSGDYTFTFNTTSKALSVTGPTRNVGKASAGVSTDASLVTLTDNDNDTFTFSASDTNAYHFTGWSISGTSGTDYTITSGTTSSNSITIRVTSDTAVTATASWAYRTYTITYHTVGGSLPTPTYTQVTANATYTGTYTYNPTSASLASLPTPTAPAGKTLTAVGWYGGTASTSPYTAAVSSIPAGTYGDMHLWYYWRVSVTFKDNITNSTIQTLTTALNTATGAVPSVNASAHTGFTWSAGSYSDNWTSSTVMDNSATVYVIYRPVTQAFTIRLDNTSVGYTDITYTSGTNTYNIPYGAKLSITASPNVDYSSTAYAQNIVYYWNETAAPTGTSAPSVGDPTFASITTKVNNYVYVNPDITSLLVQNNGTYTIYAKAYYPNAYSNTGTTGVWASGGQSHSINYNVGNPITGLTMSPVQKIYTLSDDPALQAPTLQASLNLSVYGYDATLNTSDYAPKIALYKYINGVASATGDQSNISINAGPTFTSSFAGVVTAGVNYFKVVLRSVQLADDGTVVKVGDVVQYTDNGSSADIRTVVGTAASGASRPLYLTIDAGVLANPSNYRVMAFYINNTGTLSYQTASSFSSVAGTTTYRFMIPSATTQVSVAAFAKSSQYYLPVYSGGTLSYANTNCYGHTDFVTVTDVQKISITSRNSTTSVFGYNTTNTL